MTEKLINLIFDNTVPNLEELFKEYPSRGFINGERVTRIAPSPTGFVHIGTVYMALVSERVAHQSGGIFYVRIEDTDTKREVEGSAELLANTFKKYGIVADEGMIDANEFKGNYGPYKQSERFNIYKAFIKHLMQEGLAYPCFCSEEELEVIIKQQKAQNCSRLGYYGGWAKYRNFPIEEAIKKIEADEEYVIRFKSFGDFNKKIVVNDLLKGNLEFPENDLDIVIMKKNGLPTYHFAHAVDDFLMGTTLVTRGDEWLPSLPLHIQLFQALHLKAPKYAHISPIMKMDGDGKRKLSKRKDPESNMLYFDELGYPKESVIEYLLNLANSNFEDWRKQNPTLDYKDFKFDIKKMNTSGALFDFVKLDSVSRDVIARMTAQQVYNNVLEWSKNYNNNLYNLIKEQKDYALKILNIERENTKKPRKDISKWNEVQEEIDYFFNFNKIDIINKLNEFNIDDIKNILILFKDCYDPDDDNNVWFEKLKTVAKKLNYCDNIKEYKNNPDAYKGNISDVAKILRITITGREQSPDLCSIMKVLGRERVNERLMIFEDLK